MARGRAGGLVVVRGRGVVAVVIRMISVESGLCWDGK